MTYGINVNILDIQIAVTNQEKMEPVNLKNGQIIWIDNTQINKHKRTMIIVKLSTWFDKQMKRKHFSIILSIILTT